MQWVSDDCPVDQWLTGGIKYSLQNVVCFLLTASDFEEIRDTTLKNLHIESNKETPDPAAIKLLIEKIRDFAKFRLLPEIGE